jgi:ferric-dicitrate binding protein FerR (iron transport regulator)
MIDDRDPVPPADADADAALRDAYAFAPGAAEDAVARFRLPEPAPSRRLPWLLVPAAAAAGIGAGLLLAGGAAPPAAPPSAPVAGMIALATGPISDGKGLPLAAGSVIHEGDTVVAAAGTRASLLLADGSEVRLDRGARVRVADVVGPVFEGEVWGGREIAVLAGRAWARVAAGDLFSLVAGPATVRVTGTELSVSRGPERTEVLLHSGSARVEAGGAARDLVAGQEVEFSGGALSEARRTPSEAIATGWMVELYAYAGRHERDLADHMDRMLSEMGRRKVAHLEERAIVEELGPVCRVPVARFLVSEAAAADGETGARRKAARVLAAIADPSVAAELARALRDPDAEVRVQAARAIRRVSDGAACPEPGAFRDSCDEGAAAAADAWARSCAPAPTPPR